MAASIAGHLDAADVVCKEPDAAIEGVVDLVVLKVEDEPNDDWLVEIASEYPLLVVADESHLMRAVDAGGRGFMPSDSSPESLSDAIATMLQGAAVVPPEMLGRVLSHVVELRRARAAEESKLEALTERERQVYELAASGARKDEIGARLFISPATARTHLQRIYRKLGVHSQSELIAIKARSSGREARS